MKIALCQIDISWLDPQNNLGKIKRFIEAALQESAEMAVFPEMSLTGFCMDSHSASVEIDGPEIKQLLEITHGHQILVVIGAGVRKGSHFFNQSLLIQDGSILASYSKINLFSYAKENQSYSPGKQVVLAKYKNAVWMPLICYDLRFGELFSRHAEQVTGAYLVIANWPANRAEHWKTLLRARALDYQTFVIGVNRVGSGDGLSYSGDSTVFSPTGQQLTNFSDQEQVIFVDIDLSAVSQYRKQFPLLSDRKTALPHSVLHQIEI